MAKVIWIGTPSGDGDWGTTSNWSGGAVPSASDDVYFTAEYVGSVKAGLNQSAIGLNSVTFDPGYTGNVGSTSAGFLQLACSSFTYAGSGSYAYFDLGSGTVAPVINNTGTNNRGAYGVYLKGTGLTNVEVNGGSVQIGYPGDTCDAQTLNITGGQVLINESGSVTTVNNYGGSVTTYTDNTTLNNYRGSYTLKRSAALTTANVDSGNINLDSSGTITTLNLNGGTLNSFAGNARTITTLNWKAGASLRYFPANTTITNFSAPTEPILIESTQL